MASATPRDRSYAFAVAELAGAAARWRSRRREELVVEDEQDDKIVLLRNIEEVFGGDPWLESQVICSRLNAIEDAPWASLQGGSARSGRLRAKLRGNGQRRSALSGGPRSSYAPFPSARECRQSVIPDPRINDPPFPGPLVLLALDHARQHCRMPAKLGCRRSD